MSQLRPLTAEERVKPYAKYYKLPMTPPDPELLAQASFDAPIDPADALMPEDVNALLDPGYLKVETGWCILPNGAGYVALNNKMPGVTVEAIEWWYGWHSLEDLRYMIWHPLAHYRVQLSEDDRRRVLDPSVPPAAKFQGAVHYVNEDVGMGGPADCELAFKTPEEFGFDMTRFRRPAAGTIVGAQIWMTNPPPRKPVLILHFIREVPGGIEYRTRLWMGYLLEGGRPVCVLPEGEAVPPEMPKAALQHNIEEYTHLRVLLPQLYAEFGGTYQ
jgi:hypothetical protein